MTPASSPYIGWDVIRESRVVTACRRMGGQGGAPASRKDARCVAACWVLGAVAVARFFAPSFHGRDGQARQGRKKKGSVFFGHHVVVNAGGRHVKGGQVIYRAVEVVSDRLARAERGVQSGAVHCRATAADESGHNVILCALAPSPPR
ncbi:hypothetical protein BKA81DRAFT_379954 [Phyllosticta paracitricarpa]